MNADRHQEGPAARVLGFSPGRTDLFAGLALAGVFIAFFYPVLFESQVLFLRDICQEIVPKRAFWAASQGQWLWNPLAFFGLPMAANSQWSAFYPLNFIFELGAAPRTVSIFIITHYAIALAGSFVLARSLGRSAAGAALTAIAFTFGGFFISLGNLPVMLASTAWIMFLLWAAARAVKTGRTWFIGLAGLFWGLMALGGEPEITYLSGLILVLFLPLTQPGSLRDRTFLKRAGLTLAGAAVLGAGLSAVQWALTLELAPLSNRAGGLSWEEAIKWSMEPRALITLFMPNLIDRPDPAWSLGFINENLPYLLTVYPGVLTLILAGIAWRGGREAKAAWAGALGFLLLALGPAGLLYRWLYLVVPGFDGFRIPERCIFGAAVLWSLLAGWGLDLVTAPREGGPSGRRARLGQALLGGGLTAVVISFFLARPTVSPGLDESALRLIHFSLLGLQAARWLGMAALAAGAVLLASSGKLGRAAAPALVLLLGLDLFMAHRFVNPATSADFYDNPHHLAATLPQAGRGERVMVLPPPDLSIAALGWGEDPVEFFKLQRKNLVPFTGLEEGIDDVNAHSSFFPADVQPWLELAARANQTEKERLFARSGIGWVLRPGSPPYSIRDPLPRAYIVPKARRLPDRKAVEQALLDPKFDPRREVLLEGPAPARPADHDAIFFPLRIISESNQQVRLEAKKGASGWLVLLDGFYPGWRATQNGRPLQVHRANGWFRAVEIDREGGVIEFSYQPRSFIWGLTISGLFALIVLLILLAPRPAAAAWALLALVLIALPAINGGTTHVPVTLQRSAALLLAWGAAMALWRDRERPLFLTRLDGWALALWVAAGVSLTFQPYFYQGLYWMLNLLTLLLLFYFTIQFAASDPRRVSRIMGLTVAAALCEAVWAMAEYSATGSRASAGYFNPSFLAGSLLAVMPWTVSRAVEALRAPGGRLRAAGWAGALLVLAGGLLASGSRAAILAPAGLLLGGWPLVRRDRRTALILSGALLIMAAGLFVIPNPLRDRVLHPGHDPYSLERPKIWAATARMIADHPLGVGLGMYRFHSPAYAFPVEGVMAGRYEHTAVTAHSDWLQAAAELGPTGLFICLVPLLLALRAARRGFGKPAGGTVRGLGAGLVMILAHAGFDSNLRNPSIAALLVIMLGLLLVELGPADGWIREVRIKRGTRTLVATLLTAALLAGLPGCWFLGYGYDLTARLVKEKEPALLVLGAVRASRMSFGNTTPLKLLAQALTIQFKNTGDDKLLDQALKAADQAIRLNPTDPALHALRGDVTFTIYGAIGAAPYLEQARKAYAKAVLLAPDDVDYHLELAEIADRRGDRAGRISELQRVLELEPHDLPARLGLVLALQSAGRAGEARDQWHEFLKRKQEVAERLKSDPHAFDSPYRRRRVEISDHDFDYVKQAMGPEQPKP